MKSLQHILNILILSLINLPLIAQVPALNSYPSASATVFLDFDGQYVTGTIWNWAGPIDAQASGFSKADITEMFNRVAEDYRPFDLNITTDSAYYFNAPPNKRIRVIITATSQWYGAAGGVAFVNSFKWGDNTPAWVFSSLLGDNVKYVAEAISHETGHTLGLQHQSSFDVNCNKTAEYATGQGAGEIGWAPIMGTGYYQNLTTWHIGPNTNGCNNIQDDINIISSQNGFGLRPDDHGNNIKTATDITMAGGFFVAGGLINTVDDTDAFKINVVTTTHFTLSATPQNVGVGDAGANIDIKVLLLNNTDTIGSYNPTTLLNAGIDTTLNAGTYYLLVGGVGNIYHNNNGSLGLYALTGSLDAALPLTNFHLNGAVVNEQHQLSWTFSTGETVKQVLIESAEDGKHFSSLTIVDPLIKSFSYLPQGNKDLFYRIKIITTVNEQGYLSNSIVLKVKSMWSKIKIISSANSTEQIVIISSSHFNYELFNAAGQLSAKGRLQQGINYVSAKNCRGMLLIHFCDGKNSYLQKLIKQ